MKTLIVSSVISSLMLIPAGTIWPQSLPPGLPAISGARADASVVVDLNSEIFTYSYVVTNSSLSVGSLSNFAVDITTTVGGISVSSGGLANSAIGFEGRIYEINVRNLGASVIPVGFTSQPSDWSATVDSDGGASWFWGSLTASEIGPGRSMSGFVMKSRGIPGIRKFDVGAYYEPAAFFPLRGDESNEQLIRSNEQSDVAARACLIKGMTVGPISPPSLTDPLKLVDLLISLKHQAVSLGWFFGPGSDGIVKSLDAKLNAAKDSAGRGNNAAAANQLGAFMNELDAQKGKHLNDNAYFLLKPNAQFIIGKLKP